MSLANGIDGDEVPFNSQIENYAYNWAPENNADFPKVYRFNN